MELQEFPLSWLISSHEFPWVSLVARVYGWGDSLTVRLFVIHPIILY